MRSLRWLACVACLLLALPSAASEEEIHAWSAATIVAPTSLFGEVEVRAKADAASGALRELSVKLRGQTIVVPPTWLATLPQLPLSSLQVRSERGYDPEPWLYVWFRTAPPTVAGAVTVHLAFQGGKLRDASLDTHDGKGGSKHETRAAP